MLGKLILSILGGGDFCQGALLSQLALPSCYYYGSYYNASKDNPSQGSKTDNESEPSWKFLLLHNPSRADSAPNVRTLHYLPRPVKSACRVKIDCYRAAYC
jgi:hypothetical protein